MKTIRLAAIGIVAGAALLTPNYSAQASSTCDVGSIASLSQLDTVTSACLAHVDYIQLPGGALTPVPPEGIVLSAEAAVASGEENDLVLYKDTSGDIHANLNGVIYGGANAMTLVDQSQPLPPAVLLTPCSGGSYEFSNQFWQRVYKWSYNPSGEPAATSLTSIRTGFNTWRSGTNQCTNRSYNSSVPAGYLGTTSAHAVVSSKLVCGSMDGMNSVSWEPLPTGYLGLTCQWGNPVTASWDEADIAFSTSPSISFFTSSTPTGCTPNQYDLQTLATHEFGHVLGFKHASSSLGQVMWRSQKPCETARRQLSDGDLLGLLNVYP